ncbi:MAG: dihydroxy-acid dehydratase, partial [Phycisphaerae bacterium]
VPALMAEIQKLLDLSVMTVSGQSLGTNLFRARSFRRDVIAAFDKPLQSGGSLAVLKGNLAPKGAIIKVSAASPKLMKHTGPALVFEDYEEMLKRINDPELLVTAESVLVLR